VIVRPASSSDVRAVANNLRPEDAREVETSSGMASNEAVPLSASISRHCYSVSLDKHSDPFAVFGACDDLSIEGLGVVWMVGTPQLSKARVWVMRTAPHILDAFQEKYPEGLHNYVDARNTLHLGWLVRMGFKFDATKIIRGYKFIHAIRY
jgi:hypothetical protein